MSRLLRTTLVAIALLTLASGQAEAAESIRAGRATVQAGPGLFIYLPTFRLVGRYSQEWVSCELRAGIFAPSLAIGKVAWDGAAAIRFHVFRRERITGFVAPRVGLWNITDEDEPYRQAPMTTVTGGADFHWGAGWTATVGAGGGVAWGPAFNTDDGPVVPLIELNAYVGWTF
jgi:hypothetical protein